MSSVAQENQRICLELKLPGNLQSGIGVNKPPSTERYSLLPNSPRIVRFAGESSHIRCAETDREQTIEYRA